MCYHDLVNLLSESTGGTYVITVLMVSLIMYSVMQFGTVYIIIIHRL